MKDRFYTTGHYDSWKLSAHEHIEHNEIITRTLYKCACCGYIYDEDGDEAVPREWDNVDHFPECEYCKQERTKEEFYESE